MACGRLGLKLFEGRLEGAMLGFSLGMILGNDNPFPLPLPLDFFGAFVGVFVGAFVTGSNVNFGLFFLALRRGRKASSAVERAMIRIRSRMNKGRWKYIISVVGN